VELTFKDLTDGV